LIQLPHDNKEQEKSGFNVCDRAAAARIRNLVLGYSYKAKGNKSVKVDGLGGSFTYARVGPPLLGEYRNFTEDLPAYEDIAKYVFYTETSREFPGTTKKGNPAWDKKTGRIGAHAGRSYYLLYKPNNELDWGLDQDFLKNTVPSDPNAELVVYCEKVWAHMDELHEWGRKHGKRIRPMLVPFDLK
jgi:adenine-specific DNA-methyltransferase